MLTKRTRRMRFALLFVIAATGCDVSYVWAEFCDSDADCVGDARCGVEGRCGAPTLSGDGDGDGDGGPPDGGLEGADSGPADGGHSADGGINGDGDGDGDGDGTPDAGIGDGGVADADAGQPDGGMGGDGWTCAPELQTNSQCDCGCGILDTACSGPNDGACDVSHCPLTDYPVANANWLCPAGPAPDEWTCEADYYGTNDGCDCGCAVPDPDCASDAFSECEYGYGCIAAGTVDRVDPMSPVHCLDEDVPGWRCATSSYGTDECDCGCQYPDSDCGSQDETVELDACAIGCEGGTGGVAETVDPDDVTRCLSDDVYLSTGWQRRWRVDFDTSGVTETITDVPVVVMVNPATHPDLFSADIAREVRVVDGGQEIPFDLEAAGVVWVKLPRVEPGPTHSIFVYADNPSLQMSYDPQAAAVWSNGYQAVFHFPEAGRKNAVDATPPVGPVIEYDDAFSSGVTQSGNGTLLGEGLELDGSGGLPMTSTGSDGIPLLQDATHPGITAQFMVLGDAVAAQVKQIVNIGQSSGSMSRLNIFLASQDMNIRLAARDSAGAAEILSGPPITPLVTNLVTAQVDLTTGTTHLFLDGAEVASGAEMDLLTPTLATPAHAASFGCEDANLTANPFDGFIDEVRVFDAPRTASFLWMEHQGMRPFAEITANVDLNE